MAIILNKHFILKYKTILKFFKQLLCLIQAKLGVPKHKMLVLRPRFLGGQDGGLCRASPN